MRPVSLLLLLLATAVALGACGGADDPEAALKAACKRQIEEVKGEVGGGGAIAGSTKDADEAERLSECAGQPSLTAAGDETATGGKDGATGSDAGGMQPATGDEKPADGAATGDAKIDPAARELFVSKCGTCHTLADAGTSAEVGPNLDELDPDTKRVRDQIASGGGGGIMPANLLEGDDADAVAAYVDAASGN